MKKKKNVTPKYKVDISRVVFWMILFSIIFIAGGIFALNDIQPAKFFFNGFEDFTVFLHELTQVRPDLLEEKIYRGEGVVIQEDGHTFDGLTVLQGIFKDGVQLKLIDMDGSEIHHWDVDFFKIWPEPRHLYPERIIPKSHFNYYSQGMVVHRDGSVVVNVGDFGTAKLDKCSNVVWRLDRMTHHSITLTDDGNYWIPGHSDPREVSEEMLRLAGLTRQELERQFFKTGVGTFENLLFLINSDGQVIKEFSVLKALIDNGFEPQLFDIFLIQPHDPTHVNDIEIVNPAMAAKIPGVEAGDLLVSIRQLHMLAVIDQNSGKIKWFHEGPWVRQHDPDITPDGNIQVYNNYVFNMNRLSGSNIIELDPQNGITTVLYPVGKQKGFFSRIFGSHQLLPNGNRIITESLYGCVFEINPEGKIVWEYIESYDEQYSAVIVIAERYPRNYFSVDNWKCD